MRCMPRPGNALVVGRDLEVAPQRSFLRQDDVQPESCDSVDFAAVTTPSAAVLTDDTASLIDDALGTAVTAETSPFQAVVRSPVGASGTAAAEL